MPKQNVVQAQLSPEEKRARLHASLEDHRHLIADAVKAMTKGNLVPALTIATSLRVLIHETGMSKPLLKSLRPNYLDLELLDDDIPRDDPPPTPGAVKVVVFNLPVSVSVSTEEPKIRLNVEMDKQKPTRPMTLGTWWGMPFMNLPGVGVYNRRQLVLDVANKEGAHVDVRISEQFKRLCESQFLTFRVNDDDAITANIARLVVGKAGFQMLSFLEKHFPH